MIMTKWKKQTAKNDRCKNIVDTLFHCFDDRNYFLPNIFLIKLNFTPRELHNK